MANPSRHKRASISLPYARRFQAGSGHFSLVAEWSYNDHLWALGVFDDNKWPTRLDKSIMDHRGGHLIRNGGLSDDNWIEPGVLVTMLQHAYIYNRFPQSWVAYPPRTLETEGSTAAVLNAIVIATVRGAAQQAFWAYVLFTNGQVGWVHSRWFTGRIT